MKFKKELKRGTVLALAIILAAISSLGVYAAVSYDSSKDPVVAYSGMVAYVESVLTDIRSTLPAIEIRLSMVEINGGGGGGGSGSGASSAFIFLKISHIRIRQRALRTSGGGGTSRFPRGFVRTFISRSAATERGRGVLT